MDDPELALEKAVQRLDSESSGDSEVNGGESRSVVESSVELNGMYGPNQDFTRYRHLLMQPRINQRNLNSLQNSVSGSEDNSSMASFE